MEQEQKKIHILHVDDDAEILRLFAGHLTKHGFEVMSAHDGNEGREFARRFQPDLILLDVQMPVQDGYKTLQYLKNEKETSHIPVIFLTNVDFNIESLKAWGGIGIHGYVPKSEYLEKLVDKMWEVLGHFGHERPKE
jgi:DNA-binding response OmpR family regulator